MEWNDEKAGKEEVNYLYFKDNYLFNHFTHFPNHNV